MATPIGILGGIRGSLFANLGGATWNSQPFKVWTSSSSVETPIDRVDPVQNPDGSVTFVPVFGAPREISGFRLVDSRASYGISLQTFALGFPVHFDWSWRTLFNREWEDVLFSQSGGSSAFRKPKFTMWIGYDF
jgi:hypothetical protein